MAKLYFRYGCVSSGKTLELINIAASYRAQGKSISLLRPALDRRFGEDCIVSRTGLSVKVDVLVHEDSDIQKALEQKPSIILVDEAQFLNEAVIDSLRRVTVEMGIPVMCFGLRTDFKGSLFAGSKRLLELADRLEEVKSICVQCHSKATFNLRLRDGRPDFSGPIIQLGSNESYQAVCAEHFLKALQDHTAQQRAQAVLPGSGLSSIPQLN